MASLSVQVDKCLNQKYQYVMKARNDIRAVASQYRALTPKVQTFIFNDGSSKELVCLDGTIPVRYKGKVYNIPVRIWILETHPYHAPFCYVCPTPNMQIKVSHYVDESGKVYLPYLHDWNQGSDLLGVVQVMIMVFGETPPVFSKTTNSSEPPKPTPPYPMPGGGYQLPYPSATGGTSYPQPGQNPGHNSNNNTLSISDEHIRMSLLSAVESRITKRALEFEQKLKAEEEVLRKTNDDLSAGKQRLDNFMRDMENDQRELESNISVLRSKNEELKQALEQLTESEGSGIDIDNAVTTTAPLYKQLVNAYAEESAVEDAIFFISEGLSKGVIDLDTFLKHIRELSRKQFMQRALMYKCREKANLPLM